MSLFVHAPGGVAKDIYTQSQIERQLFVGVNEKGDRWIAKPGLLYPNLLPNFDLYPLLVTGEGSNPDIADVTFVVDHYEGAAVPVAVSRKVTYLKFRKRIIADGVPMSALWVMAQTDGNMMDFLMAAQNTDDGLIDLDDQDTIDGLGYIEAVITEATVGFSGRIRQ